MRFHWQDGAEDHDPRMERRSRILQKCSQKPVPFINTQISAGKAYKDADSKGSVSVDLGASYHRSMGILDEMASWTIGFQAANLGSKLDGQKLPARLGLGGAIDLPFSMDNRLQVALDFNYLLRPSTAIFKPASERNIIS